MNKKITTLLASAMLATAFSAGAADIENGKSYLLQNKDVTTTFLSAVDNKNSSDYGQLELKTLGTEPFNLSDVVAGTWTATTKTTSGAVVYTFVNKATGLTLSVDPTAASYKKKDGTVVAGEATVTLGAGSVSEWTFKGDIMMSYFKNDSVVYFDQDGKLWKDQVSKVNTGLKIQGFIPTRDINLGADDLNTLMRSVASKDNFFALNMSPEVSKDKANHLTATGLHAVAQTNGYIRLQAKDKKNDKDQQLYVVVDTAYYEGTETSGQLLKYTYAVENAKNRNEGSYDFKFTYNVNDDKLFVQVREVVDKIAKLSNEKDDEYAKRIKENNNNSAWSNQGIAPATRADKYIYMAKLDGTYVLTLNTDKTDGGVTPTTKESQNVTIKTTADYTNLKMTTLADGVYLIQAKTTGGNDPKRNDAYALANLAGNFAWSAQARNQEFQHMPAAQWVVKKKGTSDIAPVSITNREFDDQIAWMVPANAQLFAVEGKADQVFFFRGSVKDTVSFIKVADELVKNAKLGYKYVSADDAMVQTFTFNYLHGLALDKYVYTPAGKDSIVRVDENGLKSNFRLELVVENDKYGYNDELVRNVYYISDGQGRYLSYDSEKNKYMMERYPTPFFIKENNCINGKHYYSLVVANLVWGAENQDGKNYGPSVADATFSYYEYDSALGSYYPKVGTWLSNSYASGVKVSVDDNTLDLVNGDIHDKFVEGMYENRTSAFAVEIDDSPLYRRFNNASLGEVEGTDSLYFVEKIRGEYLMDEWNSKLQDKTVDYAGIWNADKANGKLAFVVDTAWVKRGLGYIKPQYLISVARNDQKGTETIPCNEADDKHFYIDEDGNAHKTDKWNCQHAVKGHDGFHYGKYLVSFADSAINNSLKTPYMDVNDGYTRVGFVEAIHYGDSLIILTGEYEKADPAKLDVKEIIAAYKKAKKENLIVDLVGDNHKNVTWSFRYVTPSNDAVKATEEGAANEFLFESNIYDEYGNSRTTTLKDKDGNVISANGKATYGFDKVVAGSIAPAHAAWLKMQNGCLVLTRGDSKFEAAKTGSDGALIFNAYQKSDAEDMVTSIEGANAEGVSIVAGNGTVTVQGAAGKSIVITNILGKVVAETVLTSDNATIAVPAGIVAVAIDGEEAVKAIVK